MLYKAAKRDAVAYAALLLGASLSRYAGRLHAHPFQPLRVLDLGYGKREKREP
jgi:hypothetical protein